LIASVDFTSGGAAPPRSGGAKLQVAQIDRASTVTRAWATDPMKLLTPQPRGESVWAYTSSFGGGMVAGDATRLEIDIQSDARCYMSTQASTKIYRNPAGLPCSHEVVAAIGANALLVFAPDPVQLFAESQYQQKQVFHLHATGNLVLLDWMSSGRAARGERWAFDKYFSRNEIFREGRRVLLDGLLLEPGHGALAGRFRGDRMDCYATCVILGPGLSAPANGILTSCNREPLTRRAPLIFAAGPLADGALLRVGGRSVAEVAFWIYQQLAFVSELLGDDPWARKW
jgi:urease accessory protein